MMNRLRRWLNHTAHNETAMTTTSTPPATKTVFLGLGPYELSEAGIRKAYFEREDGTRIVTSRALFTLFLQAAAALGGWVPRGTDAPAGVSAQGDPNPAGRPAGHYEPSGQRMTDADCSRLADALRLVELRLPAADAFDGAQPAAHRLPLRLQDRETDLLTQHVVVAPAQEAGVARHAGALADLLSVGQHVRLKAGLPPIW